MSMWKKQGTTSGKNVFFKRGELEQTWFCETFGNRSERLSSGKLWANINGAFKLKKKEGKKDWAHLKLAVKVPLLKWSDNIFQVNCCNYCV